MINILTADASRSLDRHTVKSGTATEVELMRNAGRAVAVEAAKLISGDRAKSILVVCGKGHNGGDGLAAAGFLTRWEYSCTSVLVGGLADQDEVVSAAYKDAGVEVSENAQPGALDWAAQGLVIDALLGIGVNQPLREPVLDWVRAIHDFAGPVLAVDLPTGLHSDTGQVLGDAVSADVTVTMGYPKLGLLINDGPGLAGRIVTANIGFDATYFDDDTAEVLQFERADFRRLYRLPPRQTFKHRQGKTLVIAGSTGMTGAAILAARATLLAGAGLSMAACPASLHPLYAGPMPEVITRVLEDRGQGIFLPDQVAKLDEALTWCTAVVLGPGLSREPRVISFVEALLSHLEVPVLIDADGLAPFAKNLRQLVDLQVPVVVTPHAMEFAELFHHDLATVLADPLGVLQQIRADFPHVVVLKGAPTLTLLSTGKVVVNSSGNPGMATAGSGDVLSGVIGTFLSQGYSADEAAIMGVWLHGRAGDLARRRYGAQGLTSAHLLDSLPGALREFDQGA
ncbi:MAG: NAD(P)H-hydrate dehydratase [Candidatus Neomarinimicrobiota bacterium]